MRAFWVVPASGGHPTRDATFVLASAMRCAAQPSRITKTLGTLNGYAPITGFMN